VTVPLVPDSPLTATLARVSSLDELLAARVGPPPGKDWIEATELGARLPEILMRIGRHWKTDDRRVQAAFFIHDHCSRIAAPAIACYLAERRVPDVSPGNVAVRFDREGAAAAPSFRSPRFAGLRDDPEARPACADDETLREWLRERLEHHLTCVVSALRTYSPLGQRAQWAVAADACALAFLWAGQKLGDQNSARAEAETLLAAPGSPLRSRGIFVEVEHLGRCEIFLRRGSCCLAYRLPEVATYCPTCPLIPMEETERRLREYLENNEE
jgi:ferric iron reductase protein FhuF